MNPHEVLVGKSNRMPTYQNSKEFAKELLEGLADSLANMFHGIEASQYETIRIGNKLCWVDSAFFRRNNCLQIVLRDANKTDLPLLGEFQWSLENITYDELPKTLWLISEIAYFIDNRLRMVVFVPKENKLDSPDMV